MKPIFLPLLLMCLNSFAQPFVSGEAGTRLGLNAGYNYKNIVAKVGGLIPYTRKVASNISYAAIGYKVRFLTPFIGIGSYQNEFKGIKKMITVYSLEIGKDFTTINNSSYRLYIFGTRANENYYGAGLRIKIK